MHEFNILKKERDYFLALKGSSHCKIIIDNYSQNLPIGYIKLHVEEVSDKYKHYSNEAIFKLILPLEEQDSIDICTLNTGRKNNFVYKQCLRLGGKWESILNEWVFSSAISHKVENLGNKLNTEEIYIEATFRETVSIIDDELTLFGYPIVKFVTNGNKIVFHNNIKQTSGDIVVTRSGKKKKTIILAGTRIRLFIPKALLSDSSFHEDFMCIVDIEKKRKPNRKKKQICQSSHDPLGLS